MFPLINQDKCIGCGLCMEVCQFCDKDLPLVTSGTAYAASTMQTDIMASSSGGAYASLATNVIKSGGVAYGAVYASYDGILRPVHLPAVTVGELAQQLGSKYAQSDTGHSYSDVKDALESGKTVLYSGTACQIAGLRLFLRKSYESLFTVDIICLGVPNSRMFEDYQKYVCKPGSMITNVGFRSKQHGWGSNYLDLDLLDENNAKTVYSIRASDSSYYDCFLHSAIARDSCAQCPYASLHRPGDLTIGDFWGIETQRPDLISGEKARYVKNKGISCVLVNNEQGEALLSKHGSDLHLELVDLSSVVVGQPMLRSPARQSPYRQVILDAYVAEGWLGVEHVWEGIHRKAEIRARVKSLIPDGVKAAAKRIYRMKG